MIQGILKEDGVYSYLNITAAPYYDDTNSSSRSSSRSNIIIVVGIIIIIIIIITVGQGASVRVVVRVRTGDT